jgi:hypothetical protein
VYGCLIYYNGYDATDRGHGHGIYSANAAGNATKKIRDNMILDQFGWASTGTRRRRPRQHRVQGQHGLRPGALSSHGWTTNILLGACRRREPRDQGQHGLHPDARGQQQPRVQRGVLETRASPATTLQRHGPQIVNCSGITMTVTPSMAASSASPRAAIRRTPITRRGRPRSRFTSGRTRTRRPRQHHRLQLAEPEQRSRWMCPGSSRWATDTRSATPPTSSARPC